MAKTPQRNVNLAAKYNRLARNLLNVSETLLSPDDQMVDHGWELIQNDLFDAISATRDYVRKISIVEHTGNRG